MVSNALKLEGPLRAEVFSEKTFGGGRTLTSQCHIACSMSWCALQEAHGLKLEIEQLNEEIRHLQLGADREDTKRLKNWKSSSWFAFACEDLRSHQTVNMWPGVLCGASSAGGSDAVFLWFATAVGTHQYHSTLYYCISFNYIKANYIHNHIIILHTDPEVCPSPDQHKLQRFFVDLQ